MSTFDASQNQFNQYHFTVVEMDLPIVTGATSLTTAVELAEPQWYWKLNEETGTVATDTMLNGNLEYESAASTAGYNIIPSSADGLGSAKNIKGDATFQIYDPSGFVVDWTRSLFEDPMGFPYDVTSNQTDGWNTVVYDRNEHVGDYYTNDKWRITTKTIGSLGGNHSTAAISQVIRKASKGGKYVFRVDNISSYNFFHVWMTSAHGLFNHTTSNSGNIRIDRFAGHYEFQTYDLDPTWAHSTGAGNVDGALWVNGMSKYFFIDFDNDTFTLVDDDGYVYANLDITEFFSNFVGISIVQSDSDTAYSARLDPDPDLSGVAMPNGTSIGDWKGWNDKDSWNADYELIPFANNINAGWSTLAGSLTQGAVGGVEGLHELTTPEFTVVNTGEYVLLGQGTHEKDMDSRSSAIVDKVVDDVRTVNWAFMGNNISITGNYVGANAVSRSLGTLTTGQTVKFVFDAFFADEPVSVWNCALVRVK